MNSHTRVRMLCEGALMVAAAQILSMIKLWEMPWGGSVVLAMVPMILFAVRWGLGPGLLAGFVFGVLQFVFDGGFALGWQSIIGDYLVAFTALGLAGVMKGKKGGIYIGTVIGCLARFLVHYVVGATVWASYMPDVFLGLPMGSPWVYSFLYNIVYMGLNTVITLVVFVLLAKPLGKYFRGEDLRNL
ncbi:MAG: energy-coupled thiamine transporter ThiT [Clostridiales bacterium]|nr:energy-coupled thiamine transporter ThiT [Clostridiales bacterium]